MTHEPANPSLRDVWRAITSVEGTLHDLTAEIRTHAADINAHPTLPRLGLSAVELEQLRTMWDERNEARGERRTRAAFSAVLLGMGTLVGSVMGGTGAVLLAHVLGSTPKP